MQTLSLFLNLLLELDTSEGNLQYGENVASIKRLHECLTFSYFACVKDSNLKENFQRFYFLEVSQDLAL